MSTLATLVVAMTLTSEAYHKGLEAAGAEAESKSQSITQSLSGIGKGIVVGGIAALTGGIIEMGKFMGESVTKAEEARAAQNQLQAVLHSTGQAAGVTAQQANFLAESWSKSSKFADDQVLSGENLLLTFTNIGKDVFPEATAAMLNMSQAMGTDVKSSAIQLGKALNDTAQGMSTLARVGVTFTDEQKKQVAAMQKAGDTAGAQKLILAELNKEFGGSAEAAATSTDILSNTFEKVQETIGSGLMPVIQEVAGMFNEWLDSPAVQSGIQAIVTGITDLSNAFMTGLGDDGNIVAGISNALYSLDGISPIFDTLGDAVVSVGQGVAWFAGQLQTNQAMVFSILTTLGVLVATFVIPALISMVVAAAPVIAVIALIGAAAYLLYQAWTTDFGGIQEKTAAVWAWLQPILLNLWTWLQTNVPAAITTLKGFWENTLLPAIQKVWNWVQTVAFPIIQKLIVWVATNVPVAIQTLTDYWNLVLLPVIQAVWSWMSTVLFPFLSALADFFSITFTIAVQDISDLWKGTLQPALAAVWDYLDKNVFPIFKAIDDWFKSTFGPTLTTVSGWIHTVLIAAFDALNAVLKTVTDWLNGIIKALKWIMDNKGKATSGTGGSDNGIPGSGRGFGGSVMAGHTYPVGERGVELFTPDTSGMIIPNSQLGGGGGGTSEVHIHMAPTTYADTKLSMSDEMTLLKWKFRFGT